MLKNFIFCIIATIAIVAGGIACQTGNTSVKQEQALMEETGGDSLVANDNVSGSTTKLEVSDSVEEGKERLSVLKKSVGAHNYREFFIEEGEYSYHFMVYDSCHHSKQEIVFDADDYLNDGTPGMYAFVSPDKRYVYVVGDILANSTGWTSTFIIYQVNTETLKAKLVNAVAAVRLEKNGFKVAELSRCLTPDTVPSYQMKFTFRDVTYNFNGRVVKRSAEYSPEEISKRYGKSLINIRGLGIIRGQDD